MFGDPPSMQKVSKQMLSFHGRDLKLCWSGRGWGGCCKRDRIQGMSLLPDLPLPDPFLPPPSPPLNPCSSFTTPLSVPPTILSALVHSQPSHNMCEKLGSLAILPALRQHAILCFPAVPFTAVLRQCPPVECHWGSLVPCHPLRSPNPLAGQGWENAGLSLAGPVARVCVCCGWMLGLMCTWPQFVPFWEPLPPAQSSVWESFGGLGRNFLLSTWLALVSSFFLPTPDWHLHHNIIWVHQRRSVGGSHAG